MQRKSCAHEALSLLFQRDGVPSTMVMDGSKEQLQGEFRRKCREANCHVKQTEPYSPWQNAAEGAIREVKRGAGRKMLSSKAPKVLWDHCLELEGLIRSHTASEHFELNGQVPESVISGQPADISPFIEYAWYDWLKFYDQSASYPEDKEVYGRWLSPAIDIGPAMTAKVLKQNGQVIYLSTHRPITEDESNDMDELALRDAFVDKAIREKLGSEYTDDELVKEDPDAATPSYDRYADDVEGTYDSIPDYDDSPDTTPEDFDAYIGAEVNLSHHGASQRGKVKRRARDESGNVYGTQNNNPILDTRMYEVEFLDGQIKEYAANVIAENLYASSDPYGNLVVLMDAIVDHRKDDTALSKANAFITVRGRQYPRKSTRGWSLCIQWKDGSTSWEKLSDVKESFPVAVAEYAQINGLHDEPAFSWWCPHVLKKRDAIVSAMNTRYHKKTHKFGIRLPKTVEEALRLDRENGNHYWRDAIAKEISAFRVAFQILSDGTSPPPTYQFIKCHLVFDIKMDSFQRKARFVAGGHMTDTPPVLTYSKCGIKGDSAYCIDSCSSK
jgi:hypothetical protein